MEYLLGNTTQKGSSAGLINIKLPEVSNVLKNASTKKIQMNINTALSTLRLDNLW